MVVEAYTMLSYVFGVTCVIVSGFLAFFFTRNLYWYRRNVTGPKPHLVIGNLLPMIKKKLSLTGLATKLYFEYPNEKFVGFFQGTEPTLIIRDPDLIKTIIIKDFNYFVNRGFKVTDEPLMKNLFIEDGDYWRILRQRLSPIFTSGKLKSMMPLLSHCVDDFVKYTKTLADKDTPVEIRSLNAKYTLKGIISCAFGVEVDSFFEEKCEFREMGDKIFEPSTKTIFFILLNNIFPGIADFFNLKLVKPDVADFLYGMVRQIIYAREGKPKIRKDFMDLMIEMKEEGTVTKVKEDGIAHLTVDDHVITAQATLFYAAGFETSSGTMGFMFYELAKHPDVQEKCYEELKEVMKKYDGKLTYEALNDMPYVTMAFEETLRKYPVGGVLFRKSVTDYVFPGTNLKVEKNTKVLIPVPGIHNDPKYYPEPEVFRPERFLPENRKKIYPGAYLPFGDGPRNCIGMRFAKVASMLGVAYILFNFKLEVCEKTVDEIIYDPLMPTLASKDGLWLSVKSRQH